MNTPYALTFEDHRRTLEGLRIIYPVLSRRAKGISLGINLNPDKACNFDCIYCQVDRTVPGFKGVALEILRRELETLLRWVAAGELFAHPPYDTVGGAMRRVNDLCFAGDGEPTAAPEFLPAVELAIELKQAFGLSDLKIVVITNATMLHRVRVREALGLLDRAQGEIWGKLDAGTEAYFHRVCVTRVPFRRVLDNLEQTARVRPLVIQSLFLELDGQRPSDAELDAYVGRLEHLLAVGGKLRLVQVYTLARRPPRADIFALPDVELERIAQRVRGALGVPVEIYSGASSLLRPGYRCALEV